MNASVPNKRLFYNLATVKAPSDIGQKGSTPIWQIIVDKETSTQLLQFYKKKNKIVYDTSVWLKMCEMVAGEKIQHWQQDNTKENKILEQNMKGQY